MKTLLMLDLSVKKVYHSRSRWQPSLASVGRRLATRRELIRDNFGYATIQELRAEGSPADSLFDLFLRPACQLGPTAIGTVADCSPRREPVIRFYDNPREYQGRKRK